MSAALVTFEGYSGLMTAIARAIVNGANNCRVRLFQNSTTPVQTWTWANFTEVTIPGYAAVVIPPGIDLGLNVNNIDVWSFPAAIFGPYVPNSQMVYGYWVDWTNPMTGLRQSLWCQKFTAPFAFTAPGQTLPLALTPGLDQGPTWIPKILTADKPRKLLTED